MRLVQYVIFQVTNWLLNYSVETTRVRLENDKIENALFIIDVINSEDNVVISLEADGVPIDLSDLNELFEDYDSNGVKGVKILPNVELKDSNKLGLEIVTVANYLDAKLEGDIVVESTTNSIRGVNIIFNN